jgi:cation diffusion facilitator family transporter
VATFAAMERNREIYKVTLVGSVGNAILLTFKFVAGIVGNSSAMIADAVHSLSDFVTDILVLVFVSISAKPQDQSHDYGHGKFETIASFLIALALMAAATGIVVSGFQKSLSWLDGNELKAPGWIALWAALLSIAIKELLYQYTMHRARKLDSQVMVANAWHHRSDSLSSIGAAIGIGLAIWLGQRWTVLDPLASIVVGLMLVKVAYELLKTSMGELTECSLPEETENEIIEIILSFNDVGQLHNLRTRRIGNRIAIEAHVRMDGQLPLYVVHERATTIEQKLKERFGPTTHVSLHMEPVK